MHTNELNETIRQELAVGRLGISQFSEASSDGSQAGVKIKRKCRFQYKFIGYSVRKIDLRQKFESSDGY